MKDVLKALLHPPALIALVLGCAGLAGGWVLSGLLLLAVGAGLAWRGWHRTGARLERALQGVSVVLEPPVRERLRALPGELSAARRMAGAEQLGLQAHQQLQDLTASFLAYRRLLGQRFSPGELTYGRYLKAGEQVFLAALDDLLRSASALHGLATVDVDQVRAQLRILQRLDSPTSAEARELATLRERMALREEEGEALRGLLASNEEALTRLSAAHAALQRLRTERGLAELESSDAMLRLEELSQRVQRYSIDAGQRSTV